MTKFELTPSCEVCRQHTHARWHSVARGSINPVALIRMIETLQPSKEATRSIVGYIIAVTGIDRKAMDDMMKAEESSHE